MQLTKTAKIYADALTNDDYTSTLEQLEKVSSIIESSSDLQNLLTTPTISTEQKVDIINEIFINEVSNNILNFLKILAEKKHFNEFKQIIEALKININKIKNIQPITVISAIELNDEHRNKILKLFKDKLGKEISPNWIIDENIIGGLIVKINDNIIDTSINTKLYRIKGSL